MWPKWNWSIEQFDRNFSSFFWNGFFAIIKNFVLKKLFLNKKLIRFWKNQEFSSWNIYLDCICGWLADGADVKLLILRCPATFLNSWLELVLWNDLRQSISSELSPQSFTPSQYSLEETHLPFLHSRSFDKQDALHPSEKSIIN